MTFPKYKERGAYHYQWYQDNTFGYRDLVDTVVDFCEGRTLDVGCGDGLVCKLISEKDYTAVGIDNSKEALLYTDKLAPRAYFMEHDITWPLDGKWPYMACLNVIEHLKNPNDLLRIFRENITKAGIIITDKPAKTLGKHHIREFSKEDLLELFKDYKPEYFEPHPDFHGVKVYK